MKTGGTKLGTGHAGKPGSGLAFFIVSNIDRNLVTTNTVTVSQDSMLTDAEQVMKDKHIKWLVAVDQEEIATGPLEWSA